MKGQPKKPKASPREKRGLSKEGWEFLLKILDLAGYGPYGKSGNFVVRQRLKEDFFAALEPDARPYSQLKGMDRDLRNQVYVTLGVRLHRLRPGHPEETVSEPTLRALSQLKGLNDPFLFEREETRQTFREILDRETYRVDFLRFCRRLMAGESKVPDTAESKPVVPASELRDKPRAPRPTMYLGCVSFIISKLFGTLQLIPEDFGLRLLYVPLKEGCVEDIEGRGYIDFVLPLEAIGGMLSTALAFRRGDLSLDENVILQETTGDSYDTLIKLYRDAPRGPEGKLSGAETCWLRFETGDSPEERRRIHLTPRDLSSWIEACRMTIQLAAHKGTNKPKPLVAKAEYNPNLLQRFDLTGERENVPAPGDGKGGAESPKK